MRWLYQDSCCWSGFLSSEERDKVIFCFGFIPFRPAADAHTGIMEKGIFFFFLEVTVEQESSWPEVPNSFH